MKTKKRSNPKKARTMKAPMNGGAGVITKYLTNRLSESFNDIVDLEKGHDFRMHDDKIWIVSTQTNREYEFDSYLQKITDYFDVCISTMNNYYKKMEKKENVSVFFPTCVYNYMYFIMHKEKRRIALSTYIRHMKKMIMNYSETRYPEWDMLPQPKIERGLNNMMDAQFSNDIENVKFTLKEDINSNESTFPGFFNPNNKKQNTYTSFTIDIDTVDADKKNLAMEHNKLLLWLKERYHANAVPLDMLKGTYTDKATDEQMEFEIKRTGSNYTLKIVKKDGNSVKEYILTSHEFDIFNRHILNKNVFFKKGSELIPGFFADTLMNSAVPPSDTNPSAENPDLNSAENPNLNSFENPDLNSFENPDLNSFENPDLNSAENPDLNSAENPNLNSFENPDLNSFENLSAENLSAETPFVKKQFDTNFSDNAESAEPPSTNITSSQISENVKPQVPVTPSNKATRSTIISLNGYEGTIENLFSKIQSKIDQLINGNKIMYREKAAYIKELLDKLKAKVDNVKSTATVEDIKTEIISSPLLKFKNQKIMGGKSKRRSKKSNKSNKSNKSKKR